MEKQNLQQGLKKQILLQGCGEAESTTGLKRRTISNRVLEKQKLQHSCREANTTTGL